MILSNALYRQEPHRRSSISKSPHLGTDVLIGIVENTPPSDRGVGGSFRFEAKMTDLLLKRDI